MQVSRQHDCTTAWPAGGARAHWLRLCVDFAYGSVRNVTQDAVTRALDSCGSACTEVTFTGHSLGSAMTTRRRAVDFQAHQQRRQLQAAGGGGAPARAVVSSLFNFGSPRVGNEAFAAWASGLLDIGLSSRVTREGDEVPRIPPKVVPLRGGNRYQHVHTREVWNRHNTVPTRATWPASSTGSSSATRRTGRIITAPTQSPYARTSSGRRATRAAVSIATTSACWAGTADLCDGDGSGARRPAHAPWRPARPRAMSYVYSSTDAATRPRKGKRNGVAVGLVSGRFNEEHSTKQSCDTHTCSL